MRKLILIGLFLVSMIGYSQGGPKVDVIKFRGEVTTTVRDTFDVPTSETWLIWNATTGQLETAGSDDVWTGLSGSGVDNSLSETNQDIPTDVSRLITLSGAGSGQSNLGIWNSSGALMTFNENGMIMWEPPLIEGTISLGNHAANKAYVDSSLTTQLGSYLPLDGSNPMAGDIKFDALGRSVGSTAIAPIVYSKAHYFTPTSPATLEWKVTANNSNNSLAFEVEPVAGGGSHALLYSMNDSGVPQIATDLTDKAYVDTELAALAASEVPITDAGALYTATDVEGALAEVKGLADNSLQSNQLNAITSETNISDGVGNGVSVNPTTNTVAMVGGGTGNETQLTINTSGVFLSAAYDIAKQNTAGGQAILTSANIDARIAANSSGIQEHPDTGQTGIRVGVGTEAEKALATLTASDIWISTDASPMEVETVSSSITLDGFRGADDQTADTASFTVDGAKPGGVYQVIIDRATAPTITGSTIMPDTQAFVADTKMSLTFVGNADGSVSHKYAKL